MSRPRLPDPSFWRGKRVLLTGHTGFKGGWAALWLRAMGAEVTGLALAPDGEPTLYRLAAVEREVHSLIGDLREETAVQAAVTDAAPQIVIHMAAQALVRRSLDEPVATLATNVMGTAHLLNALRDRDGLQAVLVVTSDKVYAGDEPSRAWLENDRIGGKDPYSASKGAVELVASAYAASYFSRSGVPVATARAGNVIGGGDFAEHRLVPDLVRAVRAGRRVVLRHPESTRPWQHVLDCTAGYLMFLEALACGRAVPRALNFAPSGQAPAKVADVARAFLAALGEPPVWDHVAETESIELRTLAIDASAARRHLGWRDRLGAGVAWTAEWYRDFLAGHDMRAVTLRQIEAYRRLDADGG